jgi:sporulation protein YlmC with PRC-barrel domain
MKHLLATTAIVGLAALPGLAIAQSDQANDSMTEEQTETDSQTDTEAGTGAGSDMDTESDMEGGAQSDTEMGDTSQSGSGDDQSGSSMSGSTGTDTEGSSDMGDTPQSGSNDDQSDSSMSGSTGSDAEGSSDMGSGSDDMKSGDRPEVAEGHSEVDPDTVEASEVEGAPVMSRDGEELANVSEVLMTEDGSIESIVANVGGVLGIGSKPVEVPFDEVTLQTNDEDGEMSVIIPMSEQELEDMPEYEEEA